MANNTAEGNRDLILREVVRQSLQDGSGAPLKERFHHYVWEFYALNTTLDLPAGATRDQNVFARALT